MQNNTIDIPISEGTGKKLKALAALLGKDVGSIQEELTDIFEEYISAKIKDTLDELDGRPSLEEVEIPEEDSSVYAIKFETSKKAPSKKKTSSGETAYANDIVDSISGHSLSDDEDSGALSLEEQVSAEMPPVIEKPPEIKKKPRQSLIQAAQTSEFMVPDLEVESADDDVEKFIDDLDLPTPIRKPVAAEMAFRKPAQHSEDWKPKVRISDAAYHEKAERDLF